MKTRRTLPPRVVTLLAASAALLACACRPPCPVPPASTLPAPPASASARAAAPAAAPPVLDLDFLRLYTETRAFTRGTPNHAVVTPDGRAVLFLRSLARDKKQSLYEMDIATGAVREVVTPESLAPGAEQLTPEERARRERMRVTANGFTAFELSRDGTTLVVALSGKLFAVDRASGKAHAIETGKGAALDPHLSPDGKLVAYVQEDDVHVAPVRGAGKPRALTRGGTADRPHGLADFVAAEELDRERGFWWSPDSRSILYEDSDATSLDHLTIADPAHPERAADRVPYPRAGTPNAVLHFGLVSVSAAAGSRTTWVEWDRAAMPYVASVFWDEGAPPCLVVLDRLQKDESLLVVDPRTGKTREAMHDHDDAWVNAGGAGLDGDTTAARWLPDGSGFLWWSERDGDGRLGLVPANDAAGVRWLTPAGVQVTALLDLDPKRRMATVEWTRDGLHFEVHGVPVDAASTTPAWGTGRGDGSVFGQFSRSHDVFVAKETSQSGLPRLVVRPADAREVREIPSVAAQPPVPPFTLEDVGPDHAHVALVRPRSYVEGARYPLLDAAYAGPHAQVVALDARAMLLAQWMADATGAIVVRIDAKGTPGRGRAWERALAGKLGDVPLDGHVAVIQALAATHPEIDGSRVGVYGWSFGGTFSALAVLRRPDVFKAGVAIAPVTDWRNYDTAYTERYLGLPDANAAAYDRASVLVAAAAPRAPGSEPALLVAHGTADDNVYFFNSLELVDALARAGRSFRFLPFLGQTHQFASPEAEAAVWLAAAETFQRALGRPHEP